MPSPNQIRSEKPPPYLSSVFTVLYISVYVELYAEGSESVTVEFSDGSWEKTELWKTIAKEQMHLDFFSLIMILNMLPQAPMSRCILSRSPAV